MTWSSLRFRTTLHESSLEEGFLSKPTYMHNVQTELQSVVGVYIQCTKQLSANTRPHQLCGQLMNISVVSGSLASLPLRINAVQTSLIVASIAFVHGGPAGECGMRAHKVVTLVR